MSARSSPSASRPSPAARCPTSTASARRNSSRSPKRCRRNTAPSSRRRSCSSTWRRRARPSTSASTPTRKAASAEAASTRMYVWAALHGWPRRRAVAAPTRTGDESRLSFRCLPTDIDFNIHLNNARYLMLADLGRIDIFIRTGLLDLRPQEGLGADARRRPDCLRARDQAVAALRGRSPRSRPGTAPQVIGTPPLRPRQRRDRGAGHDHRRHLRARRPALRRDRRGDRPARARSTGRVRPSGGGGFHGLPHRPAAWRRADPEAPGAFALDIGSGRY